MGVRTTIDIDGARPVVRRRASPGDPAAAALLESRGRALQAAAGPAVVAVVRSAPGPHGGWELVTEYGGPPLAAGRLVGAGALAAAAAQVAAVLADLHGRGLAHGRLEREHILVGPDGNLVLCGFGPGPASASDDVAALGRILGELLGELTPPRTTGDRRIAATLAALGDEAQALDPDRRPSARRLAADLGALRGSPDRPPAPGRPAGRRRRAGWRALAACAAAAAAGAVAFVVTADSSRPEPSDPSVTVAPDPRSQQPSSTAESARGAGAPCVASVDHPVPASAGCPQAISVVGPAVVVDGRRVVVGRPGDEVVAGAWGCEGGVRPAVFRPDTGEVLVFDVIAEGRDPVVVQAVRIIGATGLESAVDDGGCAVVAVRTPTGTTRLA